MTVPLDIAFCSGPPTTAPAGICNLMADFADCEGVHWAASIGVKSMPIIEFAGQTIECLHGATKNPWDFSRTPGGSSGGEAAAIAAGMSPLGVGNDYAGSIRWPSQCCGVAGLKPSFGRIASTNMASRAVAPPLSIQMFAVQGPMRVECRTCVPRSRS
jgi:hypothetical protein